MTRRSSWALALALCSVSLAALPTPAWAQDQRFDIQPWRPTPGPRDLLIVPQSQPLRHLSGSLGLYFSFSLDPLALFAGQAKQLQIVKNRFALEFMGALGLGDWFELGLAMPIIVSQGSSENLSDIGQEGSIQSVARGDLSIIGKAPLVRRLSYARGFGLAASLRVNAPTGEQQAFASDGDWTFSPTLIGDYRFGSGALIALQAGGYYRPIREFQDKLSGSTVVAAAGVEIPLVRRWGLTTLGGGYVNVNIFHLPDKAADVPAEVMLGLRWYSSMGVTFTTGFNFGANCALGVPAMRFFLAAVWVPTATKEAAAIDEFKKPPDDPDGDGIIGDKDLCPEHKGTAENNGCPELDTDRDGVIDRVDECPNLPGRRMYNGCPRVYTKANKIMVLERVHFATDQDIILPESFSVLEEVGEIIRAHPEWQEILIEGHCDIRASDAYNLDLSQRRATSVQKFLLSRGIEPQRLRAQGFGRSRPIADNTTEEGMALNRRVEFTILKVASPDSVQAPTP
ncbi:MAG TPA: OmpA family protein [Pseudomonadota bacterium]|nr:OmpA family protein [Pseudomonadota bacterium]